jgi:hypothetical protein
MISNDHPVFFFDSKFPRHLSTFLRCRLGAANLLPSLAVSSLRDIKMASKKKSSGGSKKKSGGRKYSKKAGQEVRTEMHHMRSGKHKVKNRKQAIAIGLSKARKKGAKVPSKKKSSGRKKSASKKS